MKTSTRALEGEVALVTGASRGLGRVIALALADEGASLHLVADGTEEELTQVAAACAESSRKRGEISGRVRVLLWGIWVSGWESRTRGGSSQRVSGCDSHPILCATFSCR
jgi:NAD(P)-dependent dehydrogenase (short-subunit alcohol dehydrogenase family)